VYVGRDEIAVEELQPLIALPAPGSGARGPSVRARVSGWLSTTPHRLALASALALALAVCFGLAATTSELARARAAQAVRNETEPLLAQAVALYTALSDANATATTTFLTGGLEPPARRARYTQDLRLASRALTTLTRQVAGPPAARAAVASIADQLPVYSGLVEAARAGNQQALPVGAAYMRQASALLTGTVLPAADQLFATEAARLRDGYRAGGSAAPVVVLAVAAALALGLLVALQIDLARISRRVFNVPVLLATVLVLAVSVWALIGVITERDALATAQRTGSDPVEVLSATRVLAARAQTDQSVTLVSRGSDQTDPLDFTKVMGTLTGRGGLVIETFGLDRTRDGGAAFRRLAADFTAYQAEAERIASLQRSGELQAAAALASSPTANTITNRLDGELVAQTSAAQMRFATATADANSSLAGLSIAIPVVTAVAAALALFGLQRRLSEYR
jgi:CHASE3 domain sensor protein